MPVATACSLRLIWSWRVSRVGGAQSGAVPAACGRSSCATCSTESRGSPAPGSSARGICGPVSIRVEVGVGRRSALGVWRQHRRRAHHHATRLPKLVHNRRHKVPDGRRRSHRRHLVPHPQPQRMNPGRQGVKPLGFRVRRRVERSRVLLRGRRQSSHPRTMVRRWNAPHPHTKVAPEFFPTLFVQRLSHLPGHHTLNLHSSQPPAAARAVPGRGHRFEHDPLLRVGILPERDHPGPLGPDVKVSRIVARRVVVVHLRPPSVGRQAATGRRRKLPLRVPGSQFPSASRWCTRRSQLRARTARHTGGRGPCQYRPSGRRASPAGCTFANTGAPPWQCRCSRRPCPPSGSCGPQTSRRRMRSWPRWQVGLSATVPAQSPPCSRTWPQCGRCMTAEVVTPLRGPEKSGRFCKDGISKTSGSPSSRQSTKASQTAWC